MKKASYLIIGLCIVVSLLFSSCGAFEGYGRTKITWFVGLGAGLMSEQIKAEREVVDDFNKSQNKIWLVLEISPTTNDAFNTLKEKIASGNDLPDVVGPIGWTGSSVFYGHWLDMAPYIQESNYDTSVFNENLVKLYQTEEGNVGLPFAVYPAVVLYNKKIFDRAKIAYPPEKYGEKYTLPDGTKVEWSWDTLTRIAKWLTLDKNGKNATETDFDRKNIVQYGYYPQFQGLPEIGSFWGAGQLYKKQTDRSVASIPTHWVNAWKWYFDGMWGPEPFIPIGPTVYDANKSNGNPFGYGIVAMAVAQLWYPACCLPLPSRSWDIAALPSYQGVVHGRVDADTFRIVKTSQYPRAAFEVVKYLIGPASKKLLDTYGGMPARTSSQQAFFATQKEKFPWITNWDTIQAGLSYPDIPNAAGYIPGGSVAFDRISQFAHLLATDKFADFDAELERLKSDLQNIFNKQ